MDDRARMSWPARTPAPGIASRSRGISVAGMPPTSRSPDSQRFTHNRTPVTTRHCVMRWTTAGCRPRRTCRRLHKRAESCDGAADDQRVHLPRGFVGVDRLGVSDEASDVVLQQDSVTTEQFTCVPDGFAHSNRAPRLRQRRAPVLRTALVLELGKAGTQRPRRRDVAEHPHQQVLDELETRNRPTELFAGNRVRHALSYAPWAQPTAIQATPARVMRSTSAVSRNEFAFASRSASSTRTFSRVITAFCTMRNAILSSSLVVENPGV